MLRESHLCPASPLHADRYRKGQRQLVRRAQFNAYARPVATTAAASGLRRPGPFEADRCDRLAGRVLPAGYRLAGAGAARGVTMVPLGIEDLREHAARPDGAITYVRFSSESVSLPAPPRFAFGVVTSDTNARFYCNCPGFAGQISRRAGPRSG